MSKMRLSMKKESWFKEGTRAINDGIRTAVPNADALGLTNWHPTRCYEYPWILHNAPPVGKIFDIGTNPQFSCSLLGMGVERLVAHHTYLDIDYFSKIALWENESGGRKICYGQYRKQIQAVLGMLDTLDFIKDEFFDTIYCISVIEHLPPEEVGPLIDGIWRLLKPGGTAAITCDWFVNFSLGDGIQEKIVNHDLSPHLARNQMVAEADEDLPWEDEHLVGTWSDGDCQITYWDGQPMGVYGFTVTK